MSGPVELVMFGCDGVLVDSEPIAVRVDLVVLAQFGLRGGVVLWGELMLVGWQTAAACTRR